MHAACVSGSVEVVNLLIALDNLTASDATKAWNATTTRVGIAESFNNSLMSDNVCVHVCARACVYNDNIMIRGNYKSDYVV